ncbi:HMG box family protein [Trichomonas vaginalis G3]|uniref:HMG box family protein n=1 Tax=Trichomonas vaginalis (strain ATCC PRA-98 / G3) TaxID=412133 RepID=A2EAT0_TRIV3|nr:high mobility group box domain domain-containing protein [Trichomonas vaginalis G3]EAY10283.1 HMG box family protein [Trichomonas vaginalis G3]KAI5487765.1 high mobility group box domain domain-containing protein [Trichomonas vaginalis G3]|eukprot:XP_001322506.1 HMG box family protein [Trichomonas vaginalis G3]
MTLAVRQSAYNVFCSEKRAELHVQYPQKNFGELAKIIGKLWKKLTPEEKQQYEAKAAVVKEELKIARQQEEEEKKNKIDEKPDDYISDTYSD